ncbi:transmembrane channel-like protein 5 isoform X1 [Ammospiza nelsoni]|uniref:transmembrane channel-like protein 5 isoform X1 n=1 Tax=Ammospiza nelsoni TaxID=2857394 RepID=UPI0028699997|nr:transmembrane channel-like protein 5 isoform X1 [Ammospiza nelsoni]XP_059340237.1 transmembrane channel-like protein 5 isoform X1 [Ammospiza nelsoni]XP_059340238.1 transmembrane channel-like protein 5 isoform X1 [Ammospiza nelsoni]
MSYHYNEAFENPDYHFSETLEIDRRGSSQRNPFSHQTPHDSSQSDYYGEHRGREQNYPVAIPMVSLGPGSDYSQDLPSTSPYGNFTENISFEPEPELTYTPHSTSYMLDYPYTHGIPSGSEDSFIRRRNRRPPDEIFMTSSSMPEADPVCREEEDLVGSLASMSSNERIKAIQKMPKTMRKKREIRNKVLKERTKKSRHRGAQWTQGAPGVSFRRFGNALSDFFQQLRPWHKSLKIIGAEFGTSVLSYFVFLKWLLNFNIFSFLINFGFITIPQFLAAEPNNLSFTGLELLTGAGYFQQTVLYYGFYTNATISKVENGPSYNMQLAYIFTVGIYFVICFLILLFSMARFFSSNFRLTKASSVNASKLLCTWDFNITNEEAVKLQQKNLLTQIKEDLTEVNKEVVIFSVMERFVHIATHLLAWVVSLATAVAACAGVYFLSINNLELFMKGYSNDLQRQSAMLVLPVIVSLLNTLVPFLFSWLGHLEKFQTPGQHIYVTIVRNIILKISIVGILCYYWLNIVATSESQCWETLVGQDIYRLVLVDFIFCLLGSFFGEFLRRIIGTTICVSLGLPEFDIGRNVLDLIYAQTLTWIGILFSPLLPGIQMIAFLIVFFVKKVSLMRNCQPPREVWRTAQMTTSFIFLLFCPSFLGVLSVTGVTVWRLKPSEECGPFRGLPSMYAAVDEWIQTLESYTASKWVVWIYHNLIASELFFFIISTVVLQDKIRSFCSKSYKESKGQREEACLAWEEEASRDAPLHTTHPCNLPRRCQATQKGHLTDTKTHPTMSIPFLLRSQAAVTFHQALSPARPAGAPARPGPWRSPCAPGQRRWRRTAMAPGGSSPGQARTAMAPGGSSPGQARTAMAAGDSSPKPARAAMAARDSSPEQHPVRALLQEAILSCTNDKRISQTSFFLHLNGRKKYKNRL